jgi:capsular polysaccharide transport system permease protein
MSKTTVRDSIKAAIIQKRNVMMAVILRDMRTRFFNHGLGFLVVPLWPLVHMLVLLAISNIMGRTVPYGESLNVFFASGLVPTLAFMYVSRFMALSVVLNKPMMAFPIVKPMDILHGRAVLEVSAAFITLVFIISFLLIIGDDPFPVDVVSAVEAYVSVIFLAVSVGTLAGTLTAMFPIFSTVYGLSMIVVYASSGTMFVPANMPEQIRIPLSYSPVLQCVEWMRSAYYPSYDTSLLSKTYIWGYSLTCMMLGLGLERIFRMKLREG